MNEKIFERKDVYVYFVDGKPYINLSNRCTNNCVFLHKTQPRGNGGRHSVAQPRAYRAGGYRTAAAGHRKISRNDGMRLRRAYVQS